VTSNWDAATYDVVSDPHVKWAEAILERLPLRGDETVLDAGCGSGRVTELLVERLPRGRAIAVDGDANMVAKARERLARRAVGGQHDLVGRRPAPVSEKHGLRGLPLDGPVDAVFSNAVFHWVPDHDALFARLHAALKPGGMLVAQCGGKGNVARFHAAAREVAAAEPYAEHLAGWTGRWHFAGAEETA